MKRVSRAGACAVLFQPRASKAFQIMLAIGVQLPGQLGRDPGKRDIGLGAAQLRERGLRDVDLPAMPAATVSTR